MDNRISVRTGSRLLLAMAFCVMAGAGCGESSPPAAEHIISQSINAHGGDAYLNATVGFKFRDILYSARHTANGRFVYTRRQQTDSLGTVTDSLTNSGLRRYINGVMVPQAAADSAAYANSVNSVIYFALLPYKLDDAAVNATLLGKQTIKKTRYHQVKVTFNEAGGGTDHQDTFMYWFDVETHTMDYLAYRFATDGGGTRFREANNARRVGGIRFQDYANYGSPEMQAPLADYGTYFMADTLSKVSVIELKNIRVE